MWALQKVCKTAFLIPNIASKVIPNQAVSNSRKNRFHQKIMTAFSTLNNNNTSTKTDNVNNNDFSKEVNEFRASDPELQQEAEVANSNVSFPAPSMDRTKTSLSHPYHFVPMKMGGRGGTHVPSPASKNLLETEVSLQDLQRMTNKFYEFAFQDETLDKFIRSHEDPHGERFAKWIYQKLSGVRIWDEDRQTRDLTPHRVAGGRTSVVHDRTSAHVAAWHSPKRPTNEVGRHFNLEECRVWMRLHFWAMRESGVVQQSPSFADYYVRFIGHFVSVYEGSATMFARESFRWSANPDNITKYINDGRTMKDVLGKSYWDAINDLPEVESDDDNWPYNVVNGPEEHRQ